MNFSILNSCDIIFIIRRKGERINL